MLEKSIYLSYILNILVIFNLIFRERRKVSSTVGWILVLMMVPVGGLILYLVFGRRFKKNTIFKLKKDDDEYLKNEYLKSMKISEKYQSEIANKHSGLVNTFETMSNSILTYNNKVEIFTSCDDFFYKLIENIENAENFINIQFYIFKNDNIGTKIIDALIRKAELGVDVKFIYDAVGSRDLSNDVILKLRNSGIKVSAFFPSYFKYLNLNMNFRNHRKIVVIDGKVGFLGGFNVGDEYLGRNRKKFGDWRDTHLSIEGLAVNDLNLRFLMDWQYASKETIKLQSQFKFNQKLNKSNIPIQIVSCGPDLNTEEIKFGYLKMINSAKKYIYIQSPYFILDDSLLEAIKLAIYSGVDVRIMIPSKPDHAFVYWATYSYAGEILNLGAKIYLYNPKAFLHAKTIVIDDELCSIGTANMDMRSFALNFEVNAFIYSDEIAKKQRNYFLNDLLKSNELTLEKYNSRNRIIKIKESISRLLSPIL